jgi:hypothetical protein
MTDNKSAGRTEAGGELTDSAGARPGEVTGGVGTAHDAFRAGTYGLFRGVGPVRVRWIAGSLVDPRCGLVIRAVRSGR